METFIAGMNSFARNYLRLDGLSSDPNGHEKTSSRSSSSLFSPTPPVPAPWKRRTPRRRDDDAPATAVDCADYTDGSPPTAAARGSGGGGAGDEGRHPRLADDIDGWPIALLSAVRVVACFLTMMVTTFAWAFVMLFLLPWPYARVRQGNLYGHVTGKLMMWILGNPIVIEGSEFANTRGIYICNHASPVDIFLTMWLTPTGTVGIAKKEIIWYPLFGQLYVLANHLRIDRSNPAAAIKSIKEAVNAIVKNNLSLIIFPEGTRSKTGRLLPFKKGFVHMALQSQLPIIPMVITGAHHAWRKGSLRVRPAPIMVKYLRPVSTKDWKEENINEYVEMIHKLYVDHLPEAQKPICA